MKVYKILLSVALVSNSIPAYAQFGFGTCRDRALRVDSSIREGSNASRQLGFDLSAAKNSIFAIRQATSQLQAAGSSGGIDVSGAVSPTISEVLQLIGQAEAIAKKNASSALAAYGESDNSEARSMMGRLAGNVEPAQSLINSAISKLGSVRAKLVQLQSQSGGGSNQNVVLIKQRIASELREIERVSMSANRVSVVERLSQDVNDYLYSCSLPNDSYCSGVRSDFRLYTQNSLSSAQHIRQMVSRIQSSTNSVQSTLAQIPHQNPAPNLQPLISLVEAQIIPTLEHANSWIQQSIAEAKAANADEVRDSFNNRARNVASWLDNAAERAGAGRSLTQSLANQAQQGQGPSIDYAGIANRIDQQVTQIDSESGRMSTYAQRLGAAGIYSTDLDGVDRTFRLHGQSCELQ